MNSSRNTLSLAFAALALLASGIPQAHAQNNWTLTGSSSSTGGFVIEGNSTLNLGDLTVSTSPVHISLNGGDTITPAAGSFLTSNSDYPIEIGTSNNHFTNDGTITGGTYEGINVIGNGNVVVNNGSITALGATNNSYGVDMEGNNLTLINNGTIFSNYDAVYLSGTDVTFNNSGTLANGSTYGLYLDTQFSAINNHGFITSGDYGIYIDEPNNTINNFNSISGANFGIYADTANNTINNQGSVTGGKYGVYVDDDYNTINNWGTITGTTGDGIFVNDEHNIINNWGTITSHGYGITIEDNYNTINNHGTVFGGSEGVYLGDSYNVVNNWGTFSGTYAGMESNEPFNTTNNWGTIKGQTYGFYLNDSHNVLNNWGFITNSGAGAAVWFDYTGYHNDVFNNYGLVAGGPVAIEIQSVDDTLNLDGHSSVLGKITLTGSNTDVVNLNFTGLSPATIASLNSQLKPQGVGSGTATSATFTLRGVTYNIDPAIINFNGSSYQLQARTGNQAAVGAALDSLAYNPAPGSSLFLLLNAIDASGNVPAALNALSPQGFQIYGDLAIAQSSFLASSIDNRLNNLRDGSESIDTSGMGGDTVAGLSKDDGKSSKEIIHASAVPDRWGFFASGDGLFFRDGGKADTAGTIAGVDGKVGDHAVIGALFAYNNSAVTLDSANSKATIQSFTGGLYGSWHEDGFYANSLAVFTRNDYKSERNIAIPGFPASANGSTNSNQYTANIDGGYDYNVNSRLTVGPTLGLQYVHMDLFGFSESGAGPADLALGGEDVNSLQSRLGIHADYHLLTGKYSSGALDFHAAWQHEYLNNSRGIGASFEGAGLTPFSVQTASPKRDAAVVGTGVNFTFHDRLTLFTEYELELWKSSTYEQTISGGARISF